ncbi:lactococcin 972 family bacteriocin [Peribacillus sp. TH14]|uniref:lactococcin 972 family bacteriocin n=1 Tax=Peribacillus sp. TH14 TaxID=2798481 RepID=UPI0019122AF0|nr:lactococcin 972 family bacteriocin [Peribacillus sp. TH14]MBK5500141.1 lactococcin 972 family bacteriocin [Peribacillus sp. TH14]
MKKFIAGLTMCACLGTTAFGASAATNFGAQNSKSGGIELDALIEENETGNVIIDDSQSSNGGNGGISPFAIVAEGKDAGGGVFEVEWGGDRHTSKYNHPTKKHRSSASNSSATEYSAWESKGDKASVWIKSSLTGNKANWATK